MRVSIIVLNWNGKGFLQDCFQSIKSQTYSDIEVLLADNDSEDGSAEWTEQEWPNVRVVRLGGNLGYAEANNRTAELATGEVLLFLNNDTKLKEDCIERMVETLQDPRVGVVAAKQLAFDGIQVLSEGMGLDLLGYPCHASVFYADGASLMVRKLIWREINGFDNAHFIFHEDTDFCWRVWLAGAEVRVNPEAIVYHWGGATMAGGPVKEASYKTTTRRRYLGERNNLRNVLKNYALSTLLWILPLYMLVNLAEVIMLLAMRNWEAVRQCYWASYRYNLSNLGDTLRERSRIQSTRLVTDRFILGKMTKTISKAVILRQIGIPRVK